MRRLIVLIWIMILVFGVQGNKDIPVIGILSLPYEEKGKYSKMTERIDLYYSQYLNAAGAVAVPISFKLSEPNIRSLMSKLNGVLFTGGSLDFVYYDEKTKKHDLTPYGKAGKIIFDIAKEMNDNKVYFPLWGTCLGFQLLAFLASEDPYVPKNGCDCKNYNAPLYFTEDGYNSQMFAGFSKDELEEFRNEPMTYYYINWYVDYLDFLNHTKLHDFFKVLAHSPSKNGTHMFVAAMEGRKYPFFGSQFHPELKQYSTANRTAGKDCARLAQKFADFFVNEARKCPQEMTREENIKRSIWNTPIYQPEEGSFYYLFP
jgi:gamma-glutamyl hydrolase